MSDPDHGADMVPETLVIFKQLTRLIIREDFINLAGVKTSDLTVVLNKDYTPCS
jgi:hypothetical protein